MATDGSKLEQQLKEAQEYLVVQKNLIKNEEGFGDILAQQAIVWGRQLDERGLTAPEALRIADTLAMGPWTDQQRASLGKKLNDAVSRGLATNPPRRANQNIVSFEKYFSNQDLSILQDTSQSTTMKCDQIATRLFRLGIHLPSEKLLRAVIQTAIAAGAFELSGEEAYRVVNEVKRLLKQRVKNAPRPSQHIVEYPESPEGLPKSLYESAYDKGDSPVTVQVNMGSGSAVPLRKNAKAMKAYHEGPSSSNGQQDMAHASTLLMQMMHHALNSFSGGELPSLHVFKPRRGKRLSLGGSDSQSSPEAGRANLPVTTGSNAQLALPAPSAPQEKTEAPPAAAKPEEVQAAAAAEAPPRQAEGPQQPSLVVPSSLHFPPNKEVSAVLEAIAERTESRKREASHDHEDEDEKGSKMKKPKAAPKAVKPKAKAKGKAAVKPKAKAKGKAACKAKAHAKGADTKNAHVGEPPCPEPGSGTVHYRGGKIQFPASGKEFRVFKCKTDRNDRKFKVKDPAHVGDVWLKCLEYIKDVD